MKLYAKTFFNLLYSISELWFYFFDTYLSLGGAQFKG